ncbi:hypothetical protein [Roseomonas xinghualingensis]|uniref:hypothetical protein n=1 Tax=Roseomonas xinghualingensis TaxID=2986475 RepID=UPI0021F13A6B|nr:hypothetical protein [Roseomonas sp. SXEYE001]MCV4206898.1 hypothetical protein [Roseomonas sp. SXEYE001]
MPWIPAQKALQADGLPRGRGWDFTVAKLAAPDALNAEQATALQQTLVEHQLCGEKLVRLYLMDTEDKAALIDHFLSLDIEPNAFTARFPAGLSEAEIEEHFPTPLQLVAVIEAGEGLAVVFSATRGLTFREEVDPEDLPPAAREALADYDQVLGVRQEKRQTFEVVYLPYEGNLVDVRVDYPDGMLRSAAQVTHAQVRQAFNSLAEREALSAPLNLFPLISGMYEADDEGTVVELAFGTTTASTKYERMRRNNLCLRQEIYHRAGKEALAAPIEPFRVSIQWFVALTEEVSSRPELSLQSSQKERDSERPTLFEVVVRNATGSRDFNFVRGRLEHFLAAITAADALEPADAAS